MKKTIYIFTNGVLQRKDNTLFFETDDKKKKFIPVENIEEIYIFGEVTINKKLLDFISQKHITIHFFNYYGYYSGSYYPREHYNSGFMILKQAEYYMDLTKRITIAKKIVDGAITNILKILTYYKNRGKNLERVIIKIENLKSNIDNCKQIEEIMAIEGNCRNYYYESFNEIINNKKFKFNNRSKRPPQNRINALISFGNSLLYTVVLSEIYKTHLDPRIGYLHATNFRRFTLNLDIAEIFKPIITDRIIFTLINKDIIKQKDFFNELGGIYLKESGRRLFVEEMNKKLGMTIADKKLKRNISYRSIIRREIYKLEKHLIGDREYKPFITKW